jgi:hypothetical protein
MFSNLKIKSICSSLLLMLTLSVFFSCQKDISIQDGGPVVTPPDLSTKISSSVSGFVTDENDAAVMGASVQFGSSTITTDKYGYFQAKNVQVVKEAAVVTVNKTGYFKGIKTYIAKEGKAAFFRIKLMPKTIAGNVNAASGGTVTLSNGLSIKLPAGGIVNAASNAVYTGTVNVAAYWINPTAADLNRIMPGDLRGINTEGSIKILQTFGMAAVELTGSAGELLQIVNGQKATLTLPIPSSLSASAPATIPLWYFDEAKGLWKQEGSATKTGNTYVGEVGHFSFWNCDYPTSYVYFDCTLKNTAGNPIPYALAKITIAGTNNSAYGYTDSLGYVGGVVPANANLVLDVYGDFNCTTTPVYTQAFTTTNVNISLGVITISNANYFATLSGTVTNCTNTPVTNGYIMVHEGYFYTRYPLSNLGTYSFSKIFCSFPQTLLLIGEDVTNQQQSATITYVVNVGTNTVANIQACGVTTQQFINYTINNISYSFTAPADQLNYYNNNQSLISIISSRASYPFDNININMDHTGIAVGSNQNLFTFRPSQVTDTFLITTPISVNITEYGAVGQFAAGTFTGVFTGAPPTNTPYNVNCNFRVRRTN